MRVAAHLQRPTRELVWAHSTLPYSVLLRVGFTLPHALPRARCALTAPFHPYRARARRYIFCGTFRGLAPPRRYLAPCPMEPGLSSGNESRRLLGRLRRAAYRLSRRRQVPSAPLPLSRRPARPPASAGRRRSAERRSAPRSAPPLGPAAALAAAPRISGGSRRRPRPRAAARRPRRS